MRSLAVSTLISIVICAVLIPGRGDCQQAAPGSRAPSNPAAQLETGALEGTVDADQYILGPGDVLEIGFWGDVNRSDRVVVNPDGDALVRPLGPLHLAGLTLAEARRLIRENLAAYYRPGILSVSLVSIRSFQVHVVGMVKKPGAFEVNAVTRVSQAITMAAGLAENSSERNIKLIRQRDTLRVDLTRYLLLGDNKINPFLSDGDVVYVPPRAEQVQVLGSVYREGAYEFIEGETLGELLNLAGGLKPEAYTDSIEIERFRSDEPDRSEAMFLVPEASILERFKLAGGDRVFVRSIEDWHRDAKAVIRGEVKYPGIYVIEEGKATLRQLITRAGGFTDKASLAEARLIRGSYASRKFPIEAETETLKVVENNLSEKEKSLVQTLKREPKGALSVRFDEVFASRGHRPDPPLYDGDIIDIPRATWSVRVSGQVKNPGLVAFKPGKSDHYYIKQAGGFAPGADSRGTRLVTAMNGQMASPGGVEIRPGDIIWVPTKMERNWWDVMKDILEVLVQVATIYIVVDQITKK